MDEQIKKIKKYEQAKVQNYESEKEKYVIFSSLATIIVHFQLSMLKTTTLRVAFIYIYDEI